MERYTNLNKLYINGQWRDGSKKDKEQEVINPFDGSTVATFVPGTKQDLDEAYKAAQEAQKAWAATTVGEKRDVIEKAAQIIKERKEEIIEWLVKESGSSKLKATLEWKNAFEITREASSFPGRMHGLIVPSYTPGKESRMYRRPLGVIGVISPWNFPFHLSMRSVAPALATGNAVVLKPASHTPVTGGTLLAKIFEEAGLPKGLFSVVVGSGSDIGDDFVTHDVPKLISFTGSTPVGEGIAELAGKKLKKLSLELGGNNVMIVLDDADVDKAVDAAVFGKFLHQGQICIAINRILVHEKIHDEFVEKFAAKVKGLPVGNPADDGTIVGPLIDTDAVERIQNDLEDSISAGARKVVDGQMRSERLMEPVVLADVKNDMPIAHNEIFGPVAVIIKYKTDEEAVEIANGTQYGLSGAIQTNDTERGVQLAQRIETGMVHVNDQSVNDEANAAFGGMKESGLGRFNGEFVLEEFTTVQWITVQHKQRKYPF
ncbi:aldehyde dehydrogenase family protein [Pontibacter actiniarum]|uniref:Aldehyde dehydrogenase n=1 Tax=Pontibacter actiniarum TaxID=323450 RepID=A0A1X9YU03_9BACT|nr:aldehyde dehydrogenase family protein [Pontibacter actiniarum]ARS36367.1 aldehyde dehydrogenase [Pontibacter actiniarum]